MENFMYGELEDLFGDVVGKSRRGQGLSVKYVADSLGLDLNKWKDLERYAWIPDKATIARIGSLLGLDIGKLQFSADGAYFPLEPYGNSISGVHVEMIPLHEDPHQETDSMTMNGYLLVCPNTNKAAFIDPGFEFDKIMGLIEKNTTYLEKILITHGHYDHISSLRELAQETGAEVFVSSKDAIMLNDDVDLITGQVEGNDRLKVGNIELRVAETKGHTPGGISYVGQGFAFVGDALFAGSLGGTRKKENFDVQKSAVERNIFSLIESSVVFPGHGPATTVGEERKYNPFYFFS